MTRMPLSRRSLLALGLAAPALALPSRGRAQERLGAILDAAEAHDQLRAIAVWQGGGEDILVVSHGGFLNSMLRELLGVQHGWFAFEDTRFATLHLSRTSHTVMLTGVHLAPHLPQ